MFKLKDIIDSAIEVEPGKWRIEAYISTVAPAYMEALRIDKLTVLSLALVKALFVRDCMAKYPGRVRIHFPKEPELSSHLLAVSEIDKGRLKDDATRAAIIAAHVEKETSRAKRKMRSFRHRLNGLRQQEAM